MSNLSLDSSRLNRLVFCKFMSLFDVDRIYIRRATGCAVEAIVGWPDQGQQYYEPDEEMQEVRWDASATPNLQEVSLILDLLARPGALRNDLIQLERENLIALCADTFGWSSFDVEKTIKSLLQMRIEMVDPQFPGDAFFLHF